MFLAIDRVSKFTHVAFLEANTKLNAAAFLREVITVEPHWDGRRPFGLGHTASAGAPISA